MSDDPLLPPLDAMLALQDRMVRLDAFERYHSGTMFAANVQAIRSALGMRFARAVTAAVNAAQTHFACKD